MKEVIQNVPDHLREKIRTARQREEFEQLVNKARAGESLGPTREKDLNEDGFTLTDTNALKSYLIERFPPPPPKPRPKFKAQAKPEQKMDKGKINRTLVAKMGKSWQTFFGKSEADIQAEIEDYMMKDFHHKDFTIPLTEKSAAVRRGERDAILVGIKIVWKEDGRHTLWTPAGEPMHSPEAYLRKTAEDYGFTGKKKPDLLIWYEWIYEAARTRFYKFNPHIQGDPRVPLIDPADIPAPMTMPMQLQIHVDNQQQEHQDTVENDGKGENANDMSKNDIDNNTVKRKTSQVRCAHCNLPIFEKKNSIDCEVCGAPIHNFPPECISFLTGSRDGYPFCSTAHGILTCPGRFPDDNAPKDEQTQYLNYAKQQVQHNEALQIAPRGVDEDIVGTQIPEEATGGYEEMDITTEAELENSDADVRTMYAGSVSRMIDGPSPKKAKTGEKDT